MCCGLRRAVILTPQLTILYSPPTLGCHVCSPCITEWLVSRSAYTSAVSQSFSKCISMHWCFYHVEKQTLVQYKHNPFIINTKLQKNYNLSHSVNNSLNLGLLLTVYASSFANNHGYYLSLIRDHELALLSEIKL